MSSVAFDNVINHTSGFSYRDLQNMARLIAMKASSVSIADDGSFHSCERVLDDGSVGRLLSSFTPSALLGLDVRSASSLLLSRQSPRCG